MTAYLCSVCGAEIEPESVHVFGLKAAMEQRDASVYELCPKHAENVYWFIRTSRELVKRATDPARDYIPLRGFKLESDSQSRLTDDKVSHDAAPLITSEIQKGNTKRVTPAEEPQ